MTQDDWNAALKEAGYDDESVWFAFSDWLDELEPGERQTTWTPDTARVMGGFCGWVRQSGRKPQAISLSSGPAQLWYAPNYVSRGMVQGDIVDTARVPYTLLLLMEADRQRERRRLFGDSRLSRDEVPKVHYGYAFASPDAAYEDLFDAYVRRGMLLTQARAAIRQDGRRPLFCPNEPGTPTARWLLAQDTNLAWELPAVYFDRLSRNFFYLPVEATHRRCWWVDYPNEPAAVEALEEAMILVEVVRRFYP